MAEWLASDPGRFQSVREAEQGFQSSAKLLCAELSKAEAELMKTTCILHHQSHGSVCGEEPAQHHRTVVFQGGMWSCHQPDFRHTAHFHIPPQTCFSSFDYSVSVCRHLEYLPFLL